MAAAAGDFVGPRLAPAGLGFITLFFGVGQAIGPALGGYLADATGTFTIPFLTAAGISCTGAVFSLFITPIERKRSIGSNQLSVFSNQEEDSNRNS